MFEYINFNPGEESYEEYRAWQGCPTIAVTKGGRLFAGWYTGGMFEPCIDNFNVLVKSDDRGESWSKPILTVGSDTKKMNRNIDIQLWVSDENHLWVMWTLSPYYKKTSKPASIKDGSFPDYHTEFTGVECIVCKNPDADILEWSEPKVICTGFLRCKPVKISGGTFIFPAYDWTDASNYRLRFSDDNGENFYIVRAGRKPDNRVYDESMVYEYENRLHLVARTNRGYYAHTESADGGVTWSETSEFDRATSSRMYIGMLKCGLLAYIRNISDTERCGMKIMLSDNGGKSFKWELSLDERSSVSYPDLTEDSDGTLYIVHDRERDNRAHLDRETWRSEAAKEILLSKLKTDDIISGRLSDGSYTAKVISKGKMNIVER